MKTIINLCLCVLVALLALGFVIDWYDHGAAYIIQAFKLALAGLLIGAMIFLLFAGLTKWIFPARS